MKKFWVCAENLFMEGPGNRHQEVSVWRSQLIMDWDVGASPSSQFAVELGQFYHRWAKAFSMLLRTCPCSLWLALLCFAFGQLNILLKLFFTFKARPFLLVVRTHRCHQCHVGFCKDPSWFQSNLQIERTGETVLALTHSIFRSLPHLLNAFRGMFSL